MGEDEQELIRSEEECKRSNKGYTYFPISILSRAILAFIKTKGESWISGALLIIHKYIFSTGMSM